MRLLDLETLERTENHARNLAVRLLAERKIAGEVWTEAVAIAVHAAAILAAGALDKALVTDMVEDVEACFGLTVDQIAREGFR